VIGDEVAYAGGLDGGRRVPVFGAGTRGGDAAPGGPVVPRTLVVSLASR
jgi:hypothetical protein